MGDRIQWRGFHKMHTTYKYILNFFQQSVTGFSRLLNLVSGTLCRTT